MGLKGGSDDGGVRSYQVPSKVQGGAGENMSRGDEVHGCLGVRGGTLGHKHHLTLTCPSSSSTWQSFYMKEGFRGKIM